MRVSYCIPRWNSTAESDFVHYIPHLPSYSDFPLNRLAYASTAYATSCSQSLIKVNLSQLLDYSSFCSGNIIHGLRAHYPHCNPRVHPPWHLKGFISHRLQYQGTQWGTAPSSPLRRPFLIHRPLRQDIELGRAPRVSPSRRYLQHQGIELGRGPRVSPSRRCLRHQDIEVDRAPRVSPSRRYLRHQGIQLGRALLALSESRL